MGTGRAGDKRAIQRTEVELLFGPKPRSYTQKVNGKVRKLALTRALVDHAADGAISLIEEWAISSHKTKDINGLLNAIGAQKSVLIISDSIDQNLSLAVRNLPKTRALKALDVNAFDLINADQIVCCLRESTP